MAGADLPALPADLWRYCVDYERTVTGAAYSSGGQLYAWALSLWEGAGPSASAPSASAPSDSGASDSALSESARDGGSGEEAAARTRAVRYDVAVPVKAGSEGVLVLPWHAGTRPPAPLVPAGRGAVVGLGLGHSGAHIVSAAVEAVCFQLAGGLADLEAGSRHRLEVVVNGGAIEGSPWWIGTAGRDARKAGLDFQGPRDDGPGSGGGRAGVGAGADAVERESIDPEPADVVALSQARRRWAECYETLLPIAASRGA